MKSVHISCMMMVFIVSTCVFLSNSSIRAVELNSEDTAIADAVADEFNEDRHIPERAVQADVTDGVVTLTGTVSDMLARERSADIAKTVRGVTSVINLIEVVPTALREDHEIKADVLAALTADPAIDEAELTVTVDHHTVTLQGTAPSYKDKLLIESIAKGVNGVAGMENRITVAYDRNRPDAELAADIEKRLQYDVYVDAADIAVDVTDGDVALTGIVGSLAEKEQAVLNAYVLGVHSVDHSGLFVRPRVGDPDLKEKKITKRTDTEITNALRTALAQDPRVSPFDIGVTVTEGFVTLDGEVDHLKAKRAAQQNAAHTAGVLFVKNTIRVNPQAGQNDNEIEQRLRDAFLRDPRIDLFDITVDVENGIAELTGKVQTYVEKMQADDIASRTKGVTAVNNALDVVDVYEPPIYQPHVDKLDPRTFEWLRYPTDAEPRTSDSENKQR
ncbi:MAG: BON domain-containing protein [Desulfobacterales bacterium]